jgi:hypothetical protein
VVGVVALEVVTQVSKAGVMAAREGAAYETMLEVQALLGKETTG